MPNTVLNVLCVLADSVLITSLWGRHSWYREETGSERARNCVRLTPRPSASTGLALSQELANIPGNVCQLVKGRIVNILGFVGNPVCAITTQLCLGGIKYSWATIK